MDKNSFLIYKDWVNLFTMLDYEQKGRLLDAMFDYNISGIVPDFGGDKTLISVFCFCKSTFERDAAKYENRCGKNRENINKRYETLRTNTNHTDNDKDNDKDNLNQKENLNHKKNNINSNVRQNITVDIDKNDKDKKDNDKENYKLKYNYDENNKPYHYVEDQKLAAHLNELAGY